MTEALSAEIVEIDGHGGDRIAAYVARPAGRGPFPGVIVVHHGWGWDRWCKEVALRFAWHGYLAIDPNLDHRAGRGDPDDVAAKVRATGWWSDDQVMSDLAGAAAYLRAQPGANGKVGAIGWCSGGRYAYLAGCRIDLNATVDCWGGNVVVDDPAALTPKRPVAPIDLTPEMRCPILGIFGNDDRNPTRDQVDRTEAALKRHAKPYEFHRYDGAGHGFFVYDRPGYHMEQSLDGWMKVFAFYERHLGGPTVASVR